MCRMSKKSNGRSHCLLFLLVITVILNILLLSACSTPPTSKNPDGSKQTTMMVTSSTTTVAVSQPIPQTTFDTFAQAWQKFDFTAMYRLLSADSKSKITEDAFVKRYQSIISVIEAKNLQIKLSGTGMVAPPQSSQADATFTVMMDTLAGNVEITGYSMSLVREVLDSQSVWTINWSEKLIFPKMEATDKVRTKVLSPLRGEIFDRNGQGVAINGPLIMIGLVPRKFIPVKDTAIPQMAQILGIAEDRIAKPLAAATNLDWFVPIVTLPGDAKDLSAKLTAIDGVQYQKTDGRVYPGGLSAGLLTGYIGPITSEELTKNAKDGYTATDKIGKMGLELVYEQRLRGQKGGEISLVVGSNDQVKSIVARKDPVNGEKIRLTIDLRAQAFIYSQMQADAGAAAAINPVTGEILALVSTPSFDPNVYQTYIPDAVRAYWNKTVKNPFTNRFRSGYAPGSVFKLVTTAIGLKSNVIKPAEALPISGLQWQPNASWGSHKVTRVSDIGRPVNLKDALLHSDNIYFAQQALRIGKDAFAKGSAAFGIGENLPLDYPFFRSQLSNNGLTSDGLLADTSFGQGEVLLSPLHLAMIYGSLASNGNIMLSVLEIKNEFSPKVWKEQAIASKDVPLLIEYLRQVVDNPAGTGYTQPSTKAKILGKTGTAELKKSLKDTTAEENGWFVAMNVEQPRLVVAMLIEDVKNRHGSHYVVPLVKKVMDDLLQGGN